jgi:hypothetical protein
VKDTGPTDTKDAKWARDNGRHRTPVASLVAFPPRETGEVWRYVDAALDAISSKPPFLDPYGRTYDKATMVQP